MRSYLLFLLPLLLFLSSCEKEQVFQRYEALEEEHWAYKDTVTFAVEIEDTVGAHELYLSLRHLGDYPYQNLWVKVHQETPAGEGGWTRYNLTLAEKSGHWRGTGLGDIIDHQFLLSKQVQFPQPGTYIFRVHHDMRMDTVPAILDVGLRVEQGEEE